MHATRDITNGMISWDWNTPESVIAMMFPQDYANLTPSTPPTVAEAIAVPAETGALAAASPNRGPCLR
jgi:hypothetical protein